MRLGVASGVLPCRPLVAPPPVTEGGRLGSVKEKADLRESLEESLESLSSWMLIESLRMLGSSWMDLDLVLRVFVERKLKLATSMS